MKSSISRSAAWLITTRKENPDEVVAALDDKPEAVIRELEAQHKEARRSLLRSRRCPLFGSAKRPLKADMRRSPDGQMAKGG